MPEQSAHRTCATPRKVGPMRVDTAAGTRLVPILLVLSAVTACGSQTGAETVQTGTDTSSQSPTQSPAAVGSSDDFSAIEARANDLFTKLSGTGQQREAAHYLAVIDLNADFVECMSRAGYDVDVPFEPIWAGWEPNATAGAWMGQLNEPLSPMALATATSSRSEFEGAQGPEYNAAAASCDEDADPVDPSQLSHEPKGWLDLSSQYLGIVNEVDGKLGPISEYTTCMTAAGIDYRKNSGGAAGWMGLYISLQSTMPPAPAPGEEPTDEWNDYLRREADAMRADADCRRERYHQGLALLAPELDRFETEFGAEIEAMHEQWESVLEEARSLQLPV